MSRQKLIALSAARALLITTLIMAAICSSASAEQSTCTSVDCWIKGMIDDIFSGNSQSQPKAASKLDLEIKSSLSEDLKGAHVGNMLVEPSDIAENDIIIDGSDAPATFIPGAVHIPYRDFTDRNNTAYLKNVSEISRILGSAGISRDDPLVVYGECQPCGGGPSTATYVYWLLRYIGHDNVSVLNGGIDSWISSGLPVTETPAARPKTTYSPALRDELYATYDYVKSGDAQIVDARSAAEFESGSIPRAINIPYEEVLDGKRIKEEGKLRDIFGNLTPERPVIVFTTTGTKASASWFALKMIGYDAKLYTYSDWIKGERR